MFGWWPGSSPGGALEPHWAFCLVWWGFVMPGIGLKFFALEKENP